MDRRKSIKALLVGSVSTSLLIEACKPGDKKPEETKAAEPAKADGINRMKEEQEYEKEVAAKTFFTPHEMATITILADIIIPKDDVSGSASEAKVPEFIGFIVKDMPEHQTPMRGGLRWLDRRRSSSRCWRCGRVMRARKRNWTRCSRPRRRRR